MQSKGLFMLVTTTFVTFLLAFMITIISIASGSTQKSAGDDVQQTYTFVKKWGGAGTEDGKFLRPHDLDFSPDEKILYIVDRDGNRIQAFDKNGTFLFAWGKLGNEDGQFIDPEHLAVDSDGRVYVSDRKNDNIQVFVPIIE